jgi:hypothetical protein
MAREDLHFRLRIPEDLKKKVEEAAAKSERSMTAEIVSRLEQTFDEPGRLEQLFAAYAELGDEVTELKGTVKYLEEVRKTLENQLDDAADNLDASAVAFPENTSLYVALDAQGWPISWQEITLHLGELGRAGDFEIGSIEARVFNANLVSNSVHEKRFFDLYEKYRATNRSKANLSEDEP